MWMNLLLAFIPVSLLLEHVFRAPPLWVFATATLAIVPLADWLRRGTEQIAARAGQTIGGLLNVTFGNLAELIIAIFVLLGGNTTVVKAQITGSIIGNALLGLGLAFLIGTFGRERQTFSRENAGQLNSMLFLVVIALLIPALFDYTERLPDFLAGSPAQRSNLDEYLSLGVAGVLIAVYGLNLVYTLITHRDVFALQGEEGEHAAHGAAGWPLWQVAAVMLGGTALIALESEMLFRHPARRGGAALRPRARPGMGRAAGPGVPGGLRAPTPTRRGGRSDWTLVKVGGEVYAQETRALFALLLRR
jgi:Ca2+:H+ antiporter